MNAFRQMLKFRRRTEGAAGTEYALLLALIMLAAIGLVGTMGGKVDHIFGRGSNEIASGGSPEDGNGAPSSPSPTITASAAPNTASFNETVTFSWSAVNASAVNASYTLSGSCTRLTSLGAGAQPLPWSGTSSTEQIAWAPDLGGCTVKVKFVATGTTVVNTVTSAFFAPLDTTPDALNFPDVTGIDPSTLVTSDPATITGIDAPASLTASGGTVSVGSDPFTSTATAPINSQIRLQTTAPAGWHASTTVSLQAGTSTSSWTVTTRNQDTTPNSFTIATPKADPNALTTLVTASALTGFDGPLTASVTPPAFQLSKDGANFLPSGALSVNPGDKLYLRTTSSAVSDGTGQVAATVSVGDTSLPIALQTKDQTPDPVFFNALTGQLAPATIQSNVVTLSGLPDGAITMKVASANAGAAFKVNGNAWVSASAAGIATLVNQNDKIQLQLTTAAGQNDVVVSFLDANNQVTGSADWSVLASRFKKTTGGLYTFTVPAGTTSINSKLWGAGGGAAVYGSGIAASGGAGGYTIATIAVTPGETLNIYVGSGGGSGSGRNAGGGGAATAITRGAAELVSAGGGGGAGIASGASGGNNTTDQGGNGGGSSGTASSLSLAGKAGTQTGPGAGGVGSRRAGAPGSGHNGGAGSGTGVTGNGGNGYGFGSGGSAGGPGSDLGGGGGGAGHFGGGGGGGDTGGSPGGGGSGYIGGTGVSGASTTTGSGATPAGTTDSDYAPGIGQGGSSSTANPGGEGEVVITW